VTELNAAAKAAFGLQDYSSAGAINGVEIVALQRFNDDGGAITELARLTAGEHAQLRGFEVRQINFSEVDPGAVKAYHLHHRQTDVWYVPPTDKLLVVLHDCRAGSATEGETMRVVMGDCNHRLLRIPPGVAHGCRNLGSAVGHIIYMVDVQFSVDSDCDEGRLPWDHLGPEVWDVVKG